MSWEKILILKNKNWRDDEEKVETQRELSYLDWLDRVETLIMMKRKIWCKVQKIGLYRQVGK